jgi:hypothetical protein
MRRQPTGYASTLTTVCCGLTVPHCYCVGPAEHDVVGTALVEDHRSARPRLFHDVNFVSVSTPSRRRAAADRHRETCHQHEKQLRRDLVAGQQPTDHWANGRCESYRRYDWQCLHAGVAKLADAQDLKSWVRKRTCGFDSRPRHQPSLASRASAYRNNRPAATHTGAIRASVSRAALAFALRMAFQSPPARLSRRSVR